MRESRSHEHILQSKEHMFIWTTCVLFSILFPSLPFICQGSIHRALLFILLQLRMDHQDICRVVPGHQFHDLSQSTSLGFTFGKLWDGMLQGGQPQHGKHRVEAIRPKLLGHQLRMKFSEGQNIWPVLGTRLGTKKLVSQVWVLNRCESAFTGSPRRDFVDEKDLIWTPSN